MRRAARPGAPRECGREGKGAARGDRAQAGARVRRRRLGPDRDGAGSRRNILVPHTFIEGAAAFNSQLFQHARTLVRAAAERTKPNETRLPEYTDARLPAVEQALKSDAPIYPDFEVLRLSFGLERMREWLGPDDPVVRQVFGNDSPDTLANRLVRQSALDDAATRMSLFQGGQAAIDASQDVNKKEGQEGP